MTLELGYTETVATRMFIKMCAGPIMRELRIHHASWRNERRYYGNDGTVGRFRSRLTVLHRLYGGLLILHLDNLSDVRAKPHIVQSL